jgi:hypothetical protein
MRRSAAAALTQHLRPCKQIDALADRNDGGQHHTDSGAQEGHASVRDKAAGRPSMMSHSAERAPGVPACAPWPGGVAGRGVARW